MDQTALLIVVALAIFVLLLVGVWTTMLQLDVNRMRHEIKELRRELGQSR